MDWECSRCDVLLRDRRAGLQWTLSFRSLAVGIKAGAQAEKQASLTILTVDVLVSRYSMVSNCSTVVRDGLKVCDQLLPNGLADPLGIELLEL